MTHIPQQWSDYELLDSGAGMKLERWGSGAHAYLLARPDPQALWPRTLPASAWEEADGSYLRSPAGGGHWRFRRTLPEEWQISYRNLAFIVRPTNFKHTGLFPEQAVNWDWTSELIRKAKRPVRLLNLFAYTGGATVAAAKAGAEVTHVDASKGMAAWARRNVELSNVSARFITDDALGFVAREGRRGATYDAIIMDPPSYGHGATGELWKIEEHLWPLLVACADLLSDAPLFFLVNSYTTGLSPLILGNMLGIVFKNRGGVETGELAISPTHGSALLPAGAFGRWRA